MNSYDARDVACFWASWATWNLSLAAGLISRPVVAGLHERRVYWRAELDSILCRDILTEATCSGPSSAFC
jgi:hypothetical protein